MNYHRRKPFSKELKDEYDPYRKHVIKYLLKIGYEAKDHPDIYDIDLILFKDGKKIGYGEVAVKKRWEGQTPFPFRTINIEEKKVYKYTRLDFPAIYFALNFTGNSMYWINFKKIPPGIKPEIFNNSFKKGEYFYQIPPEKYNWIKHL